MQILVRVRGWQEMTPRSWRVAGPTKIPDDAVFAIKYLLIRAKMPDNKNVRWQTLGNNMKRKCYIIAGPNGAGKTTFAKEFLPVEAECLNFVNADLIALGLSPFQPEKMAIEAGRLMVQKINNCSL
jgi:hypothetical protein